MVFKVSYDINLFTQLRLQKIRLKSPPKCVANFVELFQFEDPVDDEIVELGSSVFGRDPRQNWDKQWRGMSQPNPKL